MSEENNINKVDCVQLKQWLESLLSNNQDPEILLVKSKISDLIQKSKISLNEYINITTDAKSYTNNQENIILDLRTYICANGKCKFYKNRKHCRISKYNYSKMISIYTKINMKLNDITNEMIFIWIKDFGNKNLT